jgi:hypothetical protein
MKIGIFVKAYIKKIFHHCDTIDHQELSRLMDSAYSKENFDINFPFCKEISLILEEESKRYWTPIYLVRGKTIRVSSQWFDGHVSNSRPLFRQYLLSKNITSKEELSQDIPEKINSRYRGNAIGNSQNLLVRNILSNLGKESFNIQDWNETKSFFSNCCAYCGAESDLVLEHAVPINKSSLGEHRLGNIVPSCNPCNKQKGNKDFRDFLENDDERKIKIETYMENKNYVPLGDNEQVQMILEMAYKEVSIIADRYIKILNQLFYNTSK